MRRAAALAAVLLSGCGRLNGWRAERLAEKSLEAAEARRTGAADRLAVEARALDARRPLVLAASFRAARAQRDSLRSSDALEELTLQASARPPVPGAWSALWRAAEYDESALARLESALAPTADPGSESARKAFLYAAAVLRLKSGLAGGLADREADPEALVERWRGIVSAWRSVEEGAALEADLPSPTAERTSGVRRDLGLDAEGRAMLGHCAAVLETWDRDPAWREALTDYYEGLRLARRRSPGAGRVPAREARARFEKAARLEPDFAEARLAEAALDADEGRPGAEAEARRARAELEARGTASFEPTATAVSRALVVEARALLDRVPSLPEGGRPEAFQRAAARLKDALKADPANVEARQIVEALQEAVR